MFKIRPVPSNDHAPEAGRNAIAAFDLDLIDIRRRGSPATPAKEQLYVFGRALEDRLDISVRPVSDPAADTERCRP